MFKIASTNVISLRCCQALRPQKCLHQELELQVDDVNADNIDVVDADVVDIRHWRLWRRRRRDFDVAPSTSINVDDVAVNVDDVAVDVDVDMSTSTSTSTSLLRCKTYLNYFSEVLPEL